VVQYLLIQNTFTKSLLYQSTNIPKEAADNIMMLMLNNRFIEQTKYNSFRKTPTGRKFLKGLLDGTLTVKDDEPKQKDDF